MLKYIKILIYFIKSKSTKIYKYWKYFNIVKFAITIFNICSILFLTVILTCELVVVGLNTVYYFIFSSVSYINPSITHSKLMSSLFKFSAIATIVFIIVLTCLLQSGSYIAYFIIDKLQFYGFNILMTLILISVSIFISHKQWFPDNNKLNTLLLIKNFFSLQDRSVFVGTCPYLGYFLIDKGKDFLGMSAIINRRVILNYHGFIPSTVDDDKKREYRWDYYVKLNEQMNEPVFILMITTPVEPKTIGILIAKEGLYIMKIEKKSKDAEPILSKKIVYFDNKTIIDINDYLD